jgi:hypothetical protein
MSGGGPASSESEVCAVADVVMDLLVVMGAASPSLSLTRPKPCGAESWASRCSAGRGAVNVWPRIRCDGADAVEWVRPQA